MTGVLGQREQEFSKSVEKSEHDLLGDEGAEYSLNQLDGRVHCGGDGPTYYPVATWDYLRDKTDDNGIAQLYAYAVSTLTLTFRHYFQNDAISFVCNIGGADAEIITLFPASSTAGQGLRYEVCTSTFSRFANIGWSVDGVFPEVKERRDESCPGRPWPERIRGFITTDAEIDRIADALEGTTEV